MSLILPINTSNKKSSQGIGLSFATECSKAIILKAQARDKFAITQIYHTYKSPIYSLAFRMLNDKQAAEDILQTVVEKIIVKLPNLSEPKKLGSWIKSMTYNSVIDLIRKNSKVVMLDEPIIEFLEYGQISQIITDDSFDLSSFLSTLKEIERLVVTLHAIEGYTHSEVSKKVGISESNSKQIYRRTLKKLESMANLECYSGLKKEASNAKQ